jgi:magnesium transporter
MIGKTIQPEIAELIERRDLGTVREVLLDWHPGELAELIADLPNKDQAVVFRILPRHLAADTFEYMDLDMQMQFLKELGQKEVASILNEMAADDRTAMLEELPGPVVAKLLDLLTPDERKIAQTLLGYPEDSVGRLMSPYYIAVRMEWTVQNVFEHLRNKARHNEALDMIYVVDEKGRLIDDIKLHSFVLAQLDHSVDSLMDRSFISLPVSARKEEAVRIFRKYDRTALPVIDAQQYLVGMVTVDDVIDVLEETDTEDIQKFGGMEALELPYTSTPLWQMVRKRAGWLVVLFLSEMLTATAMGYFEGEIARAVVLALFVPLIISSGGNSGSQAATLTIRAMALGEITLSDWWNVMKRELGAGVLLGMILGCIGFLRISSWSMFSDIYGPHWLLLALTVAISLVGVVLWGTLSGSMLPFILRRLGFDPAASSAPFVATLCDVTGLVIYFVIAALVLHGTLL